MSETRYIREYTDGVLTAEIPYEVSDEQLYQEELEKECNESHTKVKLALDHWAQVTLAQKDQLLQLLAKFYILECMRRGLSVL